MPLKRSATDMEASQHRPRRPAPKRTKVSPSDEVRSNSSNPSSCSVSEDSALQSSPPPSDRSGQSSRSSVQSSDIEDSDDAQSSSSEGSSDADSDGEEAVVTIGGPKKPHISGTGMLSGAQDLQSRLSALLPQLVAANEALEEGGAGQSMEDVEEGEQHIEMDLGLGVLEEKFDGEGSSGDEEDEESGEEGPEDGEGPISSGTVRREQRGKEMHVMDKLLGHGVGQRTAGIEDLG